MTSKPLACAERLTTSIFHAAPAMDRNEFRADKLFRTGSRMLVSNIFLFIRDTPPVGMYVLNMFCMRGSRLWGSRLHRACVV